MGSVRDFLLRPIPGGIFLVLLGLFGTVASISWLAPAVRAARGEGITGTFTLVQLGPCKNHPPPPRRQCTWFGDFRSDDGRTFRRNVQYGPRLPLSDHHPGDTIPARDVGDHLAVYPLDAARSWRTPALGMGMFSATVLGGILWSQPWNWRKWIRRRREIGRHRP